MQGVDITKYTFISFDVFDTLIFRTVAKPEDIFLVVQELYIKKYGHSLSSFHRDRLLAEKHARDLHVDSDISLDEIYLNLGYEEGVLEILKDLEIFVELHNCVPNKQMVDFVKYCQSMDKRVAITTDMYLPRKFFDHLLVKLGIEVDIIIISSEERATKRSGKLYPILLQKLGVDASQVLHIGDNPINDISQAKKNGIDAVETWSDIIDKNTIVSSKNIVENRLNTLAYLFHRLEYSLSAFNIGFSIIGPLLFDFCTWLHEQKVIHNIDKLFFLAREGYLLEKCYKCLYPEEESDIAYIYINKNLLRLPLLDANKSLLIYKNSLLERDTYTWPQIFDTFLIPNNEEQRRLISTLLSIPYEINISRIDLYNGIYDNYLNKLIDFCQRTIIEQSCYLMSYLTQNGFFSGKVGLVNNSINGNGQMMLETYLHSKCKASSICGLQFIDSEKCKINIGNRYSTYFSSLPLTHYQQAEFSRNSLIFEHLLFEPVGTGVHFSETDNGIIVINKKLTKEKQNYAYIRELQQHAFSFVEIYKNYLPIPCKGVGVMRYLDFIHYPSKEILEPICSLWDEDVDNIKIIADDNIPLRWNYKLLKNVPHSIIWIEGYLTMKCVNRIWLFLVQIRFIQIFYRFHHEFLFYDLFLWLKKKCVEYYEFMKHRIIIFYLLEYGFKLKVFNAKNKFQYHIWRK